MDNYVDGMKEFLKSDAVDTSKIPYKRVLAVGDVHGHFTEFISLYNKLDFSDDDLLILLGDLITGGNENLSMIRWAMAASQKPNVIILMGNAEDNFRFGSFGKELRKAAESEPQFVADVTDFIENLPTHFMLDGFFFCHGGIDPKKPLTEQSEDELLYTRPQKFAKEYLGETLIVVGHTRVQYFDKNCSVPAKFSKRNILLLDTGARDTGLISCVDVLSGKFWQSDVKFVPQI